MGAATTGDGKGTEEESDGGCVVLETAVLVSRPKFCGLGLGPRLVTAGLDWNTEARGSAATAREVASSFSAVVAPTGSRYLTCVDARVCVSVGSGPIMGRPSSSRQ